MTEESPWEAAVVAAIHIKREVYLSTSLSRRNPQVSDNASLSEPLCYLSEPLCCLSEKPASNASSERQQRGIERYQGPKTPASVRVREVERETPNLNNIREDPFFAPLPAAMQAAAKAACLRISGASVVAEGLDGLIDEDRLTLDQAIANGALWRHLGGEAADREAIEFLEKLGANAVLVEDPAEVPALLELADQEAAGRPIGLDLETTGGDRPWLNIKQDGMLAKRQDGLDGTALAPYRGGKIAT